MPDNQPYQPFQIYGVDPVPTNESAMQSSVASTVPAPVSVSRLGTPELLAQGAAALRANQRVEATALESMGAAMTQWAPAHAYEWYKAPSFAREDGYNAAAFIKHVPFQLSLVDEEFIISKSRSTAEAQYMVEGLRARNEAAQAMGDSPVTSFLTQTLDPTYLAIDYLSVGAARLLRGGRAVASATAGGLTAGMMVAQSQVTPVSTAEIVLNSMGMAGATGMFYRAGKLHPVDAAFPEEQLARVTNDLRAHVDSAADSAVLAREVPIEATPLRVAGARATPEFKYTAQSGKAMLAAIETGGDPLLATMAKRVNALLLDDVEVRVTAKKNMHLGRENYDPAQHAVYISKNTPPNVQLHEMTHALTAHKILYGMANPESVHGKIVQEIEALRQTASEAFTFNGGDLAAKGDLQAYLLQDPHEFVAGVFSGKSEFTDLLASIKLPSGGTVLSKLVDGVRRILGMAPSEENALLRTIGLTEKLAESPLDVMLVKAGQGAEEAMHFKLAPPTLGSTATVVKSLSKSKEIAKAIEWSWHKSFSKYSAKSAEIADLLMDSPTVTTANSAASIQRAVRADLSEFQYRYEEALLEAMSAKGAGLFQRVTGAGKAIGVQQGIEREVYAEMMRRNRAARDGLNIIANADPLIVKMADALDDLSKRSLQEMQHAGVTGADLVSETAGYVTRRWDIAKIEAIEVKMRAAGMTDEAIRTQMVDTVSIGIQRANGWDAEVANDVAGAIYDRTKRKGMFQDAEFNAGLGEDSSEKLRSLLAAEGMQGTRLQRVLDVLEGKKDEAGKLSTLKNRVDMHLDETMPLPDGTTASILDMLDTNVAAITERYLDTTSSRVALAQKGLTDPSDIANLRKALASSIDNVTARGEAVKSFDEMVNVLQGNPVGEEMLSAARVAQTLSQMVGLAKSGLWQLTEYSTIMARYGAGATIKSMLKEMPFVRDMVRHEADSLREVLARNSAQDTRLRPFIARMEDNFEIPMSDSMQLALMQARQLVPYANAMKFIQKHQARTSANLIVDTIVRGAKGDTKALAALESYGLESHSMTKVAADISAHGMNTSQWSNSTWEAVRGPLTKMMDDAVLRARLGEIPQFAHTSTLGKFLFTFRSFTLAAHNKVLANTLHEQGYGGIGLLLAYQIPMTTLATAVGTGLEGKPQEDLNKTVGKAFSQLGALGLFTEVFGIVSGNKQQFGSPGLISVDRLYKVAGALGTGSVGNTAAATMNSIPLVSSFLPAKALGNALKDNKE